MNIEDLRKNIDEIDEEIISLLEKRYKIVKSIGNYKKIHNIDIYDHKREKEIYLKIENKNIENKKEILKIFEEIIKISKEIQ